MCLAILSPSEPQEMAWSPSLSLCCWQAGHWPSLVKTGQPNLYLAEMIHSGERRWRPRLGDGVTFNQSPACGRVRLRSLAVSLCTPLLEVTSVSLWCLRRSILRLMAFWANPVRFSLVASSPCLAESSARSGAGKLVGLSASVTCSIFSFKSWEERMEAA